MPKINVDGDSTQAGYYGNIYDKARGTSNIFERRLKIEMDDVIAELQPDANPLLVISSKIRKQPVTSYKYEWFEEDPAARWFKAEAAILAEGTSIEVTNDVGVQVAVDDLLKVAKTGEVMLVTGISDSGTKTTITVKRGIGTTKGAAIAKDDYILVMANALPQGSNAPSEKRTNPFVQYNYTQIFKTPFSITNTLDASALYGEDELGRLRRKAGIEHAVSIEYAIMFGQKSIDLTGSQPRTTTGGVLETLINTPNKLEKSMEDVTQEDMDAFLQKVYNYGSTSKLCLASPSILGLFTKWAKEKLMVTSNETRFGMNVMSYLSPYGELKLVKHPLLVDGYDGLAIVIDTDELSYRPLTGRDTRLLTNIQENDEDGKREMYITEAGVQLKLPRKHGVINLTGGTMGIALSMANSVKVSNIKSK